MVTKLLMVLMPALLLWGCSSPPATGTNSNNTIATPTPGQEQSLATPTPSPRTSPAQIGKVKETKLTKGTFRGFEGSEFRLAIIELDDDDSQENFLVADNEALLYFLAANLDKPLELTCQVIERTATNDRSGTGKIDQLVGAKDASGLTQDVWWQQQKAANPDEAALRKKYNALVEQATEEEK